MFKRNKGMIQCLGNGSDTMLIKHSQNLDLENDAHRQIMFSCHPPLKSVKLKYNSDRVFLNFAEVRGGGGSRPAGRMYVPGE